MATIDLTDATITIGGVDVSGYVQSISIPLEREIEELAERWVPALNGFTLYFRGKADAVHPRTYRTLLGRTHPRVRRMHTAYGRRRGRGRW